MEYGDGARRSRQQQQQQYYGSHQQQQHTMNGTVQAQTQAQAQHPQRNADFSESTVSLFSSSGAPELQARNNGYDDPYDTSNDRSMTGQAAYPTYGQPNAAGQRPPYSLAASTSMADLGTSTSATKEQPYNTYSTAAHSMTELATGNTAKSGKKQPKVYETAFGPFSWRDLLKRKFWKYYAGLAVLSVLVALAVIFHDDIIKWFQPIAEKIRDIPGGWMIFVGIMFVISFPPLAGQEVICLLCGLIYGLWIGFAVICLGTMLGEWGNFILFKWGCTARSKKLEEKDVTYACICKVIREGGFRIAFMARLSAIPGHLTTPAFAACGMSLWVFTITAIVTLPKQLMAVYLGTVFGKEDEGKITTSKIVEWIILGLSFLITVWAAWYIYKKMAKWRPIVLQEQAERQAAAAALVNGDIPDLTTSVVPTTSQPVSEGGPGIIVTSPSTRTNRLSGRWPQHHEDNSSRMREVDLEEARSPLVRDAYNPAGHNSDSRYPAGRRESDGYQQNGLYPVQTNQTYDSQQQEDISFGYADGGEAYTQRLPSPYEEHGQRRRSMDRQPSPRQSEQYSPYASPDIQYQQSQPSSRRGSYTQPDVPLQETRRHNPQRILTPEGAPRSEQAEELELRSQPSSSAAGGQYRSDRRGSPSRPQAQAQPQGHPSRSGRRGSRSSQPPSRYPGMYGEPQHHQPQSVSQTHYHSRPPPSNGNVYHRDTSSPAPTYHTQHPVHRTVHQQDEVPSMPEPEHMQFPPSGAPPRYQTAYRQQ